MRCPGLAPHFQIELTRDGRLDEMTILVEASVGQEAASARTASARQLAEHIKGMVGVTARVRVGDPGSVERSLGKARRVVDKRSAG